MTLIFSSEVVIQIHDELIKIYGGINGIKSKGNIEFCLDEPFNNIFGQQDKYPTLFLKAAALLYCIAGYSHPFVDGNKRTAFITTKRFLQINGYDFTNYSYSYDDVKDFMLSIASGEMTDIQEISEWIEKRCIKNRYFNMTEKERISMFSVKIYSIK